jgi:type IV pilus assembly protein PilB
MMPVSDEIQRIIMRGGNAIEIAEQARLDGARALRQSGLPKIRRGLTSLEEMTAVTNV